MASLTYSAPIPFEFQDRDFYLQCIQEAFIHVPWAQFRTVIAGGGVGGCSLMTVVSSIHGGLGQATALTRKLCAALPVRKWRRRNKEKVWLPSTLSTCFLVVGEASAWSRHLRGRKGWVQGFPSFSLHCQPSSLCRLLSGLSYSPVSQPGVSRSSVCLRHALALVYLCFRSFFFFFFFLTLNES